MTDIPIPRGLPDPERHADFYADTSAKRAIAWLVDVTVIVILTLLAIPLTAFLGLLVLPFLMAAVSFTYRTLSLARWSATPGMLLVAVEIRAADGGRLDFPTAAAHTMIYITMASLMIVQAVSALLMVVTPRGRGLHDAILGTAAVNRASIY